MNQLQEYVFEKNQVRVIEIDGQLFFVGKDVASALGYKDTDQAIRKHVDEEDKLTRQIDGEGQIRNMKLVNESGLYALIFGSNLESAKRFKRWVTSEVLPQIRKNGYFARGNHDKSQTFKEQLMAIEYTSKILCLDETSKLQMLIEAHRMHGVPTAHLPLYIEAEPKKSLTQLLKEHNINLRAAKVNEKLIELGLLEVKERPSSKGGMKQYKSLTEKGSMYGVNVVNPKNPRETQPLYYSSKFNDLLNLLMPHINCKIG